MEKIDLSSLVPLITWRVGLLLIFDNPPVALRATAPACTGGLGSMSCASLVQREVAAQAAGGIVFPDKFIGLIYEVMCGIKFVEMLTEFGLILNLRGGQMLYWSPLFFDRAD